MLKATHGMVDCHHYLPFLGVMLLVRFMTLEKLLGYIVYRSHLVLCIRGFIKYF